MRATYSGVDIASARSATKTFLLLEAPTDKSIELIGAEILNRNNVTTEQLAGGLYVVTTKGSPAGSSVTIKKHNPSGSASGCTVTGDLTTEPTTYESEPIVPLGFTNVGGARWRAVGERDSIILDAGDLIGLKIDTSTFASTIFAARFTWIE